MPYAFAPCLACGPRDESGMRAESLFELVSIRDLIGPTIEPDPGNPPNLKFLKHGRVEYQEFAAELRKAGCDAPYAASIAFTGKMA